MASTERSNRRRIGRPLDLEYLSGFPLRQEIVLRPDPGPEVDRVTPSILEDAGFTPFPSSGLDRILGTSKDRYSLAWVGERGVRRRGMTSSTAVVPIAVVFVAGAILGGLDAYILGSPLVGVLWVLGAAATSGIFWLRFGGTYDSDLILLTVSHRTSGDPGGAGWASVVLWGARVRSHIQADLRLPEVVSGPIKLASEIGSLSREIRRRLVTTESGATGATH